MKTSPTKVGFWEWLLGRAPERDPTPYPLEGETVEQCRRRLRLADNQNPSPRPDWRRPTPPKSPPPVPTIGAHPRTPADLDQILADNTRLLMENQRLRQTLTDTAELRLQLANAKHNEAVLARRAERLRKTWPAIHKQFFSTERKKP